MDKRRQTDDFVTVYHPLRVENPSIPAVVMNDRLQEFAQRAVFLCGLACNGAKVSFERFLQDIKSMWKRLKSIRKQFFPSGNPNKQVQTSMLAELEGDTFKELLRNFANKLNLLVALEVGGKIEPLAAYRLVKRLYQRLKYTYNEIALP